jgi:RNA polymerase sigma-70 factor (ECF subfamily)
MANASTMHSLSDEELALRAQQGCAASLDQLLRRYQVPVVHFLRHRGARADAEDLLQETFLRVFTRLEQYSPRWPFRTWVFTIARHVSINHHRRRPLPSGDQGLPDAESNLLGPAETAALRDGRQRLWAAAARVLTDEESSALWLHYVESLSIREVAAVLGKSWISVKVQIFRSRRKLAPELQRLGHGPPDDAAASSSRPPETRLART